MSSRSDLFLKKTVGDDFMESLTKFDLWKPQTRSVVDHEEVRTALQIVPRVLMAFLISNLASMEIGTNKKIDLPVGDEAQLDVTKHERDVYSGSIIEKNKVTVDFKYRTIPGLGLVILSTFELYDVSELSAPQTAEVQPDIEGKVQKLIEERMALHCLINAVVDKKMLERDAIKDLLLARISEQLKAKDADAELLRLKESTEKKSKDLDQLRDISVTSAPMEDPYFRGLANGIAVADSVVNEREPQFIENPKKRPAVLDFMEKRELKKAKKSEFSIVMAKGETVCCPDCQKSIFTETGFSACICFGDARKLYLKKTDTGVKISFPSSWDKEDMKMLLEILWRKNGNQNA
jgi:hypothetical protein